MTWTSPFSLPGRWLKGNLHTHTIQSDGALSPADALGWYRDHGYDFLAITDHWVFTPGSGVARADGLLQVAGAELHGPGYHMLCVGLSALPPRELEACPEELANAVRALGGLPYFAHPYWTGQSSAEIMPVTPAAGIEVYNAVCDLTRGLGYSRVHWDELLGAGRRLTGLAVDDVHWKHGAEGRGWVMVRAEKNSETAVLAALADGAFYSTTGPAISDLAVVPTADGTPALTVRCSPCASIVFHARGPRGKRFDAPAGQSLDAATLPIREEQVFLRVECHDGRGGTAWSNPVYVADIL